MKQGIQSELPDGEVNEYGCYALCLIALAEHNTGQVYANAEIMGIINFARVQGWLGAECYVNKPGYIYSYAGNLSIAPEVEITTEKPAAENYIICNKKPMYTHFTAVIDHLPWDPLPPWRPGNHGYKPASYRVIKEM